MDNKNQAGFSVFTLVILIFAVLTITGIGFFILSKHHTPRASNTTSRSPNSSTNDTGISGIVTNGGCPGAQSVTGKNNCYRSPEAAMKVTATNRTNGATVSAVTNAEGVYHITVPVGTYTVSAHQTRTNVIAECQDATAVVVKSGVTTQQNFDCSNGLE